MAVSADCAPMTPAAMQQALAPDAGLSKWTMLRSPNRALAKSPEAVYLQTWKGFSNVFGVEGDPPSHSSILGDPPIVATTLTSSTPLCIGAGTYSFSFTAHIYHANARNISLESAIIDAGTQNTLVNGQSVVSTDATSTSVTSESRTLTITVKERTRVSLRFAWTFVAIGCLASGCHGDDLFVSPVTVAKTA